MTSAVTRAMRVPVGAAGDCPVVVPSAGYAGAQERRSGCGAVLAITAVAAVPQDCRNCHASPGPLGGAAATATCAGVEVGGRHGGGGQCMAGSKTKACRSISGTIGGAAASGGAGTCAATAAAAAAALAAAAPRTPAHRPPGMAHKLGSLTLRVALPSSASTSTATSSASTPTSAASMAGAPRSAGEPCAHSQTHGAPPGTPPWSPKSDALAAHTAAAHSPAAPLSPSVVAVHAPKLQAPSYSRARNTPSPGPRSASSRLGSSELPAPASASVRAAVRTDAAPAQPQEVHRLGGGAPGGGPHRPAARRASGLLAAASADAVGAMLQQQQQQQQHGCRQTRDDSKGSLSERHMTDSAVADPGPAPHHGSAAAARRPSEAGRGHTSMANLHIHASSGGSGGCLPSAYARAGRALPAGADRPCRASAACAVAGAASRVLAAAMPLRMPHEPGSQDGRVTAAHANVHHVPQVFGGKRVQAGV
eukprot:363590-Chlamydomonas_euryale.AAC.2